MTQPDINIRRLKFVLLYNIYRSKLLLNVLITSPMTWNPHLNCSVLIFDTYLMFKPRWSQSIVLVTGFSNYQSYLVCQFLSDCKKG